MITRNSIREPEALALADRMSAYMDQSALVAQVQAGEPLFLGHLSRWDGRFRASLLK